MEYHTVPLGTELIAQCSRCLLIMSGRWRGRRFVLRTPFVSHSICESCKKEMLDDWRRQKEADAK